MDYRPSVTASPTWCGWTFLPNSEPVDALAVIIFPTNYVYGVPCPQARARHLRASFQVAIQAGLSARRSSPAKRLGLSAAKCRRDITATQAAGKQKEGKKRMKRMGNEIAGSLLAALGRDVTVAPRTEKRNPTQDFSLGGRHSPGEAAPSFRARLTLRNGILNVDAPVNRRAGTWPIAFPIRTLSLANVL